MGMGIYLEMRVEVGDLAIHIWPFAVGILVLLLLILWFRKHSLSYLLCAAVFGIYLLFALDKVFFPIAISGSYAQSMRQEPFSLFINLIPFQFGPFGATLEDAFVTLMQNVLLTIPFGFGLSFILPIKARHFLWLAFAVGFGIELSQLVISLILGYPYRYIDINDVLMNALGVLIGYSLFVIFSRLYLCASRYVPLSHRGLTAYIHAVASRAITPSN